MTTTRRLAAILAADVAGYSRLMGADEVGTLEALKSHRCDVLDPVIAANHGRIVKTTGDGMLVEFASAVDAVTCAMSVQKQMAERDANGKEPRIQFRIGINIGDIISDGDDIFGDGVNVAARVENECEPGGVCLSGSAHEQVRGKTAFSFDDLGERQLKNIERPVRLYAVSGGKPATAVRMPDLNRPLALPDKPSIAVLPFQNMSGDPEQEYFADGIVEDITTALSRFKSLFVIARNSSFTYKGRAADIKQVGRELGVRYVLEGSVRKAGGRVRITGQLVEAATGAHLWADRFDGALEDVFDLQDNVTARVVGAVAPRLVQADIEIIRLKPTAELSSYDVYMRGCAYLHQMLTEEALQLFKKAIELDPSFALAYARAANCLHRLRTVQFEPISDEEHKQAVRWTERALQLAADDADVVCSAAAIFSFVKGDFSEGAMLADRAVELNPNLAAGWNARGWIGASQGEYERALADFARAMRLNPIDPRMVYFLCYGNALTCFFLKRPEEGTLWAEKTLLYRPGDINGLLSLAMNARLAGRADKASEAVARIRELHPKLTVSYIKRVWFSRQRPSVDQTMLDKALDGLGLPE